METYSLEGYIASKSKVTQNEKANPKKLFEPKTNVFDGSMSKKSFSEKDFVKMLSREELEQLVLTQGQHSSISSLSSLYSLTSQLQSRNSMIENVFDPNVNSVPKNETLPCPQIGHNRLLEYSPEIANGTQTKEKDNMVVNSVPSAFEGTATTATIEKVTQNLNFDKTIKNGLKELGDTKRATSSNMSLAGYDINEFGSQPNEVFKHAESEVKLPTRSISPFKQNAEHIEKENFQISSKVDHFGNGIISYLGSNREIINNFLPMQMNTGSVARNIRNETSSSAYIGAMKALQEKLKRYENENEQLRKLLDQRQADSLRGYSDLIERKPNDNEFYDIHQDLGSQNELQSRDNLLKQYERNEEERDEMKGQIIKLNDLVNQLRLENENLKKRPLSDDKLKIQQANQSMNSYKEKAEGLKKDLKLEQEKGRELSQTQKILYNANLELEAQLQTIKNAKIESERILQAKIEDLENKLKEVKEQNNLYLKDREIMNQYCGIDKKFSIKDLIEDIQSQYKVKVEQLSSNIEILENERKKLKEMVQSQNDENIKLKKKITSLEKVLASYDKVAPKLEKGNILEQLKQINTSLMRKAKKVSDTSNPSSDNSNIKLNLLFKSKGGLARDHMEQFYKKQYLKVDRHRSTSDLANSQSQSQNKSQAVSKSPSKDKSSPSLDDRHQSARFIKENDHNLSFSRITTSPKEKESLRRKSLQIPNKKGSKKSKTPEKKEKKANKNSKDNISNSKNYETFAITNRSNSFHKTQRHPLVNSSVLGPNEVSNKKKKSSRATREHSPKFFEGTSILKPKSFYTRNSLTDRTGEDQVQKDIMKLESEINNLKKDHKNMLINQDGSQMNNANGTAFLKKLLEQIGTKSQSLSMLKSQQKKISSKKCSED